MSNGALWTVEVDSAVCVGNKMCAAAAPGVFVVTGGKSAVRTARVTPSADLVDAYESCPVSAIVVRDVTGEEIEPEI